MKFLLRAAINALAMVFWVSLMLGFDDIKMTVLTVSAAVIHEGGHIAALALLCKKGFSLPRAVASGFRIKSKTPLSYKEEITVCLCGPLINVFAFILSARFFPDFAVINLATAISNLLPLSDYDGGKILFDSVALKRGIESAEKILPDVSLVFSSAALFLSLFLILKLNGGYWIFFVFFIITVRQIFLFQNHTKNEH